MKLKAVPAAAIGPDSPRTQERFGVKAGILPTEQAEKYAQHAAACDHCSSLLRTAVEDFADDVTQEESELLSRLKSAESGWQLRMMAARLREASQSPASGKSLSIP